MIERIIDPLPKDCVPYYDMFQNDEVWVYLPDKTIKYHNLICRQNVHVPSSISSPEELNNVEQEILNQHKDINLILVLEFSDKTYGIMGAIHHKENQFK